MQHEITLGGDAPRSMLAGLRLQVEALEALGQTSAGGVDPRVARECARRLQALANRSDTHPHNKDRRSTFGRQGSESEVSLDDKRTLLSRWLDCRQCTTRRLLKPASSSGNMNRV